MLVLCAVDSNQVNTTPLKVLDVKEDHLIVQFQGGNNSIWIVPKNKCMIKSEK